MMKKKQAKELLKQSLNEIPHLKRLHYKNQELIPWENKVRKILEEVSDRSSWEYVQFSAITHLFRPTSDLEKQEAYNSYLDEKEITLKLIIDKYETLYKKLCHEVKDIGTTIIAKFMAEKTK